MLVLPGANELDGVLTLTQLHDQLGQRQCHAIDFGWPGFGDHSNSQCRIFGLKVFHQQVFGRCMFHEPHIAVLI